MLLEFHRKRTFLNLQVLNYFKRGILLVLLVMMWRPAVAEDLTWERAWDLARHQSVAFRTSQENVTIAHERVREAYSAALPSLTLSGMYSRNLETPVFFINGEPFRVGLKNTYTGQATLTQPLWVAGKVGVGVKAAKAYLRQAQARHEQDEQDLKLQLTESFYGTILAGKLVETAQTALDRATNHRDRSSLLYKQGMISEYDDIRAEVQVANLKPPLLEAKNRYELAKDNLRRMLDLDLTDSIHVIGTLETDTTLPPPVELEDIWNSRSEVEALKEGQIVQKSLMKLTQRDLYLPSFYMSLNYETQSQSDDFTIGDYRFVNSSAAVLTMSWPLFDGFRTPARAAQARAELRKLDYAKLDLRQSLQTELDNARRELERSLEIIRVQEDNVRVAQRAYDIAQVRYESGLGTQLELLDSEFQLDQARVNHLRALYDAKTTRARLERAMGVNLEH